MTGADVLDGRRALGVAGLLRAFGDAGVLAAADVHVAQRLARLAGEDDEQVQLAAALAVRAPRLGHVLADLATIAATAVPAGEQAVEAGELPWPEPGAWAAAVAASPLVATEPAPLRLEGTRLYLDRFWCEERAIADDLAALAACEPDAVDEAALREGLARLFPEPGGERQALAAETVVRRGVTVIAGGPGTGKTTTVARALALLVEQAAALGRPAPLIALAAPTGKAATRLQEAVHEAAGDIDARPEVRERLRALDG
ncbi:MAG TPA: AAA family ATPase, partial [Baekduia sp.]|nr:AAA family ATPase [Baekduia sp.]